MKAMVEITPDNKLRPVDVELSLEDKILADIHLWDGMLGKTFSCNGYIIRVAGIPEDYRVYVDNKPVFEIVYDNVYNINSRATLLYD